MTAEPVHHRVEPVADRRRRTAAESLFVRFPLLARASLRHALRLRPESRLRGWYFREMSQSAMAALSRGDLEVATAGYPDDLVLIPDPMATGFSPQYVGFEGAAQLVADWEQEFDDLRWEAREVHDAGEAILILAVQYGRGRESDAEVTLRFGITLLVIDGLIRRVEYDLDWDRALARLRERA